METAIHVIQSLAIVICAAAVGFNTFTLYLMGKKLDSVRKRSEKSRSGQGEITRSTSREESRGRTRKSRTSASRNSL